MNRESLRQEQLSIFSSLRKPIDRVSARGLFESFVRLIQRVPFLYILSLSSQPESLVSLSAFLLRGVDRRRAPVPLSCLLRFVFQLTMKSWSHFALWLFTMRSRNKGGRGEKAPSVFLPSSSQSLQGLGAFAVFVEFRSGR